MSAPKPKRYPVPLVPGATFYVDAEVEVVGALQGLLAGTAQPHQQKLALEWIIEKAAGAYSLSHRESPHDSAFHEGRRFVGLEIVKYLKVNFSVYERARKAKQGA
jgi:hypothetical protein